MVITVSPLGIPRLISAPSPMKEMLAAKGLITYRYASDAPAAPFTEHSKRRRRGWPSTLGLYTIHIYRRNFVKRT